MMKVNVNVALSGFEATVFIPTNPIRIELFSKVIGWDHFKVTKGNHHVVKMWLNRMGRLKERNIGRGIDLITEELHISLWRPSMMLDDGVVLSIAPYNRSDSFLLLPIKRFEFFTRGKGMELHLIEMIHPPRLMRSDEVEFMRSMHDGAVQIGEAIGRAIQDVDYFTSFRVELTLTLHIPFSAILALPTVPVED